MVPIATTRTGVKRAAREAGRGGRRHRGTEPGGRGHGRDRATRGPASPSILWSRRRGLGGALAEQGTLFLYGVWPRGPTSFPLFPALTKNLTLRAYTLFSVTRDPALPERGKRFVIDGIEVGPLQTDHLLQLPLGGLPKSVLRAESSTSRSENRRNSLTLRFAFIRMQSVCRDILADPHRRADPRQMCIGQFRFLGPGIELCLILAKSLAEAPTSKRDLARIQEQFNAWAEETKLPYAHLSRICAMSIGENVAADRLHAYRGEWSVRESRRFFRSAGWT